MATKRAKVIRYSGFVLFSAGLWLLPSAWAIDDVTLRVALGGVLTIAGVPLARHHEHWPRTITVPAPPEPAAIPQDRASEQVYSVALHDVRRMIETMRADDRLVAHVYRRLAKAVAEVHDMPELEEYARDAEIVAVRLGRRDA